MNDFDNENPSKHITYLDANNLYAWGMVQNLPYGGFKWVEPEDFKLQNVRNTSKKGHILEVALEYPKKYTIGTMNILIVLNKLW